MNTENKMIKSFLGNIDGWKSVLNSSPDLIAILDTSFNVVWVNKAMATSLDTSPDSCLGLKCFEAVHGTQSPIPNCPHAKMILDGHEYTEEVNEKNLGGYFFVTASPIKDESGNVLGSIHIARDITERKITEKEKQELLERTQQFAEELEVSNEELHATTEELQAANEKIQRFADIVESSDDAIITKSLDGIIIGWNKGAEEIYDYSAEEIIGEPISILEPFQLSKETEELIDRIKSGEKIDHYETLRLTRDSKLINVSVTLSPVFNTFGELVAISAISRDITARKKVEKHNQKLLENVQQFAEELEVSNEDLQATNEELQVSNEELQDTTEKLQATTEELQVSNEELQNTTEELQVANEELRQQSEDMAYLNQELRESEQRVRLKLESIISPDMDIGDLDLVDILDIQAVQSLMDNFYELAPIPMAIIDLKGEVLVGVGWQDICTNFHRVHPETHKHCIESDTQLSAGIPAGEFKRYKCKNNMWDIATPIIVGGKHMGNLFSGQFFFDDEEVDYELFKRQALKYGFNEEDYILALGSVPRLGREFVDKSMAFFINLAEMISQMSYNNIKLARSLTERDTLMSSLRESEQRINRSQEIGHIGSWELDLVNNQLFWSDEVYRIFGLQPQEFGATYGAFLDAIHPDDREAVDSAYSGSISEGRDTYEIEHRVVRKATGEIRIVHEKCEHIRDESGQIIKSVGLVNDITEGKKSEKAILWNQKRNELLAEVSSRLLTAENPQDIINDICQKTIKFLECDVFFNYLVDEQKGCLHLNTYAGIHEEEAQKIEWLEYGAAVCGCVALESRRIVSEDILENPDPKTDLVRSYGVQAYACHPLMAEGKSIGTLSFGTNSRTSFTDEELELMKAVADQISIAMNRLISNRALKESEEVAVQARNEWEQTFEAVPDLIAILDTDYNVVRANKAMADKFGITPEECIGLTCYEVIHGMEEPPSFCPHMQLLKDGLEHTEEVHEDSLGGDFLVSASPLHDSEGKLIGSVHVARDINERKRKENELYQLNRAYKALSNSSQAMISAKDELDYLESVCDIVVEDCGHSMVWIGYAENDENKTVQPMAHAGFDEGYVEALNITWEDNEHGNGPTGTAIRTQKPAVCKNMLTDPKFELWREAAVERGYASSLVLPLIFGGKSLGALSIYSPEPDAFSVDEVELLSELANNLAYGINVIRLRVAREQMEEALIRSENEFRALAENSPDVIARFDRQNRHIYVNPAAAEPYGLSQEEIIGKTHRELGMGPENCEFWERHHNKVFATGEPETMEFQYKSPQGEEYYFNTRIVPEFLDGEVKSVLAISRDITYIKEAEAELKEARDNLEELVKERTAELEEAYKDLKMSEEQLKRQAELLDLTHEAIIVRDIDGKILFWNDGAVKTYGWSMEEANGKITHLLLNTKFPTSLKDLNDELISKGQWDGELVHTKCDGTHITVLSRQVLKNDENGKTSSILEINSDISERKKMEEELEFAGKYNRSLIETSLDPLVTIGPNGKITDVNGATEAVTGYSRDELIGTDFSDYFTQPHKAREGYIKVFREGWVIDYPLEILHKNGHITPVLYNASVYEDGDGNVIGVFAAARDITELKRAEAEKQKLLEQAQQIAEELEASNEELLSTTNELHAVNQELEFASKYNRSLIETSLDPLVTIGPDGKITDVNMATELITGYSRDELVGTDFSDYFTERDKAREGYKEVFRRGQVFDYPLWIKHKDGPVTPVLYNASVYRNESGEVIGVFAAARDITERKKAEKLLKLKLDELARSNAELEQFAYVSSHDLQEPLRMIGSYLQLLQRRYHGQLDDKADKYINFAVDGASRMQNLINDLLEFSRVTTRANEFESTDCEVILDHVLSNLEVSIKENEAVISQDHLPTVLADPTQLAQVFQNLISNAIKFRSEKVPKIYISAEKEGDHWIFSVADNGIGIDPKHSEKIFEVFKRLHKRREYPGTGIGLSICKKIIERHGGHIWIESEPEKGSIFYFTLSEEGVLDDKSDDS